MNSQDRELFIDQMTNPAKNNGTTALLTSSEAEDLFMRVCSLYSGFNPKSWVIVQIFSCADDYIDFWVSHNPSEELFIKYINYIQKVKCDEIALQVIADWLTSEDHYNGYDTYYLNSGRVVRFYYGAQ